MMNATPKYYEDDYEAYYQPEKLKRNDEKRKLYFLKQRIVGIILLLITAVAAKFPDGDVTFALVTVPLGCLLIFTKEKVLTIDYFFEED